MLKMSKSKYIPLLMGIMMWVWVVVMLIPMMCCMKSNSNTIYEWSLLPTTTTQVSLPFMFDITSLAYSTVVIFISANVLMFSTIYMAEDKFINRFTILVIMFIISMNMLIFIPHLMILLLGWDGLGITSFILVIYYQNPKSLGAGLITALTNRIGDVALLLSIAWTLKQGHWNILEMDKNSHSIKLMIAIMLAAMTKSAQMPFSSWLPAAMAAPTPVSALVHSSTLVTAGVFLMIRFYPFLSIDPMFNKIMLFLAVSTMLMAGISATNECDMKKIIALSTLSQLGMMMTSIGLGYPQMTFIHMVIHALFKALLFICAGNLINIHGHGQDLRWMGNTTKTTPISSSCILIANSALCGIPFTAGFYSKDMIIESSMYYQCNLLMLALIMLSVSFTAFYSTRMSLIVIWGPRLHKAMATMNDNMVIGKPMITMSFMSVVMGATVMWLLPKTTEHMIMPASMKYLTLTMVTMGIIVGWMNTNKTSTSTSMLSNKMSHYASCMMWFLVPMSSQMMLKMPLVSSHYMLKSMDQAWMETSSGQGMHKSIMKSSSIIQENSPQSPNSYMMMSVMMTLAAMASI